MTDAERHRTVLEEMRTENQRGVAYNSEPDRVVALTYALAALRAQEEARLAAATGATDGTGHA